MSNSLAFAAVTTALQSLISRSVTAGLPEAVITELSLANTRITAANLDRVKSIQQASNLINVHLYRVSPNAALRNLPTGPGAASPLAVDLHYLISAHCSGDDDRAAQILLAQVQRILHESAVLRAEDLRAVLPGNDVAEQFERVRIHPEALTIEEMHRLWSMYQTQARLSVGYTASVVLLDATAPARAPLPVLQRVLAVRPSPSPLLPELRAVRPPQGRGFAELGDALTLSVRGDGVPIVALAHARWAGPVELVPTPGDDPGELALTLPADPEAWPAGPYSVTVVFRDGPHARTTQPVPLALAPKITSPLPLTAVRDSPEVATVTLACAPHVLPAQRVALVLDDREVAAHPRQAPTDTLVFTVSPAPAGSFRARLRVDGVDSDLLDRSASTPTFDPDLRLTIP